MSKIRYKKNHSEFLLCIDLNEINNRIMAKVITLSIY